jgi:hypothetical protein
MRTLSPTVMQLEREANHSHPFSAEVKNAWSFTSNSKQRHNFKYVRVNKLLNFMDKHICLDELLDD